MCLFLNHDGIRKQMDLNNSLLRAVGLDPSCFTNYTQTRCSGRKFSSCVTKWAAQVFSGSK